eukprot:9331252-Alexandrium_andersonii.AAC.1
MPGQAEQPPTVVEQAPVQTAVPAPTGRRASPGPSEASSGDASRRPRTPTDAQALQQAREALKAASR